MPKVNKAYFKHDNFNHDNGLILDTHVWIWLNLGSGELSKNTINTLEQTAMNSTLFISAISIWEVATLSSKKRINLKVPLKEWIINAISQDGISVIELSPGIMIESAELPGDFHGDPADRLIIASARINSLPILTRDRKILSYAEEKYITAIAA